MCVSFLPAAAPHLEERPLVIRDETLVGASTHLKVGVASPQDQDPLGGAVG